MGSTCGFAEEELEKEFKAYEVETKIIDGKTGKEFKEGTEEYKRWITEKIGKIDFIELPGTLEDYQKIKAGDSIFYIVKEESFETLK